MRRRLFDLIQGRLSIAGGMSAYALGCAETMRDEGAVVSVFNISASGGYFRFLGVIAVLKAGLGGYRCPGG